MRNPNEVATFVTNYTDKTVITFQYTSASVCAHDVPGIEKAYPDAEVKVINKRTVQVTLQK